MSRTADTPSAPAWRRFLAYLGGAFLGAVLLLGGLTKSLDVGSFAGEITRHGLDFLLPAIVVAFIALALEMGLGTALVLGIRRAYTVIPAALLVAFFLFLTGRDYYKDSQGLLEEEAGCGCFGNLVDRTPAEAFWQDLLLMVPALLVGLMAWSVVRRPWARLALSSLAAIGILAFAAAAPSLPLDNYATRLRPGVEASGLCSGSDESRLCVSMLIPELEQGEHWVVLSEIDDELGEQTDALNSIVFSGGSAWVLAEAEDEDVRTFFWSYGPSFEIREAPAALLAPLHRTLPRSFRVVDGEVVETVSGWPPASSEAPPLTSGR